MGCSPLQAACWLGTLLITLFSPFCPRELDEEISADLADEVGAAALDRLVLRLRDLGGGATGRGWLAESGMSLWLERGWGDGDVGINKDEKNKEELPFQLALTEPGRQGRAWV